MSAPGTAYDNLLLDVRPRPIRSATAHRRALRQIEQLMSKPHLSRAESEIVELLAMLIEEFESARHPVPAVRPSQMLEHLLDARGITKAQLARASGVPRSVLTNILAGRRAVSKATAIKLARYFDVSLSLFIEGA
jgi:HTH-type transcriptional regulator/antitoxin HigA